jgi:hypothetical protein
LPFAWRAGFLSVPERSTQTDTDEKGFSKASEYDANTPLPTAFFVSATYGGGHLRGKVGRKNGLTSGPPILGLAAALLFCRFDWWSGSGLRVSCFPEQTQTVHILPDGDGVALDIRHRLRAFFLRQTLAIGARDALGRWTS